MVTIPCSKVSRLSSLISPKDANTSSTGDHGEGAWLIDTGPESACRVVLAGRATKCALAAASVSRTSSAGQAWCGAWQLGRSQEASHGEGCSGCTSTCAPSAWCGHWQRVATCCREKSAVSALAASSPPPPPVSDVWRDLLALATWWLCLPSRICCRSGECGGGASRHGHAHTTDSRIAPKRVCKTQMVVHVLASSGLASLASSPALSPTSAACGTRVPCANAEGVAMPDTLVVAAAAVVAGSHHGAACALA